MNTNIVEIYTDGACRGNPGPGGFGAILRYQGKERILSGARAQTTNNQMELMATIEALKALKKASKVALYTDSKYVQQGITLWAHSWQKNGWKTADKKPIKNQALWQELISVSANHQIDWHWVKGHSGHPENERADSLANEAIDALLRG